MKLRQTAVFGVLAALLTLSAAGRTDAQTKAVTADQAVKDVAKGLSDGKPVVLWQALPASYQKDVKGLITDAAAKMDADVFKKGVAVLQKTLKVLKDKKSFILTKEHAEQINGLVPGGVEEKKLSDAYDGLIGVLQTLATSELSDLAELKKADVEKFLTGTGAKISKQGVDLVKVIDPAKYLPPGSPSSSEISDPFKGLKVTVVKAGPKETVLKIETASEKEPKEETFVLVEGKWIPKEMQDKWADNLKDAKAKLSDLKALTPAQKQQAVGILGNLDSALDKLAATKSAEEFQKVAMEAAAGLMGGAPPKQ